MKVSALLLIPNLFLYQASKVKISPEAEAVCGDAYCQVNYEIRKAYEQDPQNKDKVEECRKGKPIDYVYCLEKSTGAKEESLDLERKVNDRFIECHEGATKSNTTCTADCKEDPLREGIDCWLKLTYISKSNWKDLDTKNHECLEKNKLKQNIDCRLKANEKYYKKMYNTKFLSEGYSSNTKVEYLEEPKPDDKKDNNSTDSSNSNSTETNNSNSTDSNNLNNTESKQEATTTKGNGANQLLSTITLPATLTILAILFV